MLEYHLKSTLILLLLFGMYVKFLSNTRNFSWNRRYLIIVLWLAIIIPLVQIPVKTKGIPIGADTSEIISISLQEIVVKATTPLINSNLLFKIILFTYYVGLLWGIVRIIIGFWIISKMKLQSTKTHSSNYILFEHESIPCPCTHFNSIFLPNSLKDTVEQVMILRHEQAHVRFKHSYDKLFLNILQSIFWFNPLIYLIHKELELIHEYQADEFAQIPEVPTEQYAKLLGTQSGVYQSPSILFNSFHKQPIKNRITMLYLKPTHNIFAKWLLITAAVIISLSVLSTQTRAQKKERKGIYDIRTYPKDTITLEKPNGNVELQVVIRNPDTIYNTPHVLPEFYGGEQELVKYLTENIKYPENAKKKKIQAKVLVEFFVNKNGNVMDAKIVKQPKNSDELAKEALRVVSEMPKWKPGKHNGENVNTRYMLPIVFQLD